MQIGAICEFIFYVFFLCVHLFYFPLSCLAITDGFISGTGLRWPTEFQLFPNLRPKAAQADNCPILHCSVKLLADNHVNNVAWLCYLNNKVSHKGKTKKKQKKLTDKNRDVLQFLQWSLFENKIANKNTTMTATSQNKPYHAQTQDSKPWKKIYVQPMKMIRTGMT